MNRFKTGIARKKAMGDLSKMIRTVILLALVVISLLLAACYSETPQTGTLEGTVVIGPIWPVERPGAKPPISPEVYEARKVLVYNEHRTKLVKTVDLRQDGYYRVELRSGAYIVDINYVEIDSSRDVPKKIEIRSGETEVNIDLDTGIR
jgi:hypothetical protein